MSDTPRTDARVFDSDLVSAAFARELERKNNELVEILARSLAELPVGNIRTHTPESIPERVGYLVSANTELERENASFRECLEYRVKTDAFLHPEHRHFRARELLGLPNV